MTAAGPIRLLLVSVDPVVSGLVRAHLDRSGLRYSLEQAHIREEFFDRLSGGSPDLVLAHVNGTADLNLREILRAAEQHEQGVPVVILGEQGGEQFAIRILGKAASDHVHLPETDYLRLKEVDRLPSMIQRSLRAQRTRMSHMRLENEVRHATSVLRESQRLVTIGRLTGSIAHEINNPLEAVTNLLFLMEHEPGVPAKVHDYLKLAQKELDRAVQISKQTLNFYRDPTSPVPTRLSELLDEVLVLYGRRIDGKQIEVIRRFGEEEPLNIFPGEIRQVFSNLIANAIEATKQCGKLFLRIRKSHLWADSGIMGLRITVADSGAGMSAEVRRRIGEPFYTTKGQAGTGLGLWVSQSITERYGGDLLVRSSTGKHHGTVFSIFLPMNLRPHAVGSPVEAASALARLHASRDRDEGDVQGFARPRRKRDPANRVG